MFYLIREPCGPLQTHGARVQSAVEGQCVTWGSVLHCCEFKGKQCGSDVWRTGGLSLLLSLGPHANPWRPSFSPAVHAGLLCLGHGHCPHTDIWMEPRLWPRPVPLLPAPYLCSGPGSPPCCPAGPPAPSSTLPVQPAPKDPPRLGEDPTHPLHSAGGRLQQWAGGCQPRVRGAVGESTLKVSICC